MKILRIQNTHSKLCDLLMRVTRSKSHIQQEQLNFGNSTDVLFVSYFFSFLIRQVRTRGEKHPTELCSAWEKEKFRIAAAF